MAIALEIPIRDLLLELTAHTLVFFSALEPAGAIAAGATETFLDSVYYFFVFV